MSEKVTIYHHLGGAIEIWVEASFENGNLRVEGYDIGSTVSDAWGDSDYEYSVTISSENMPALSKALGLETFEETALLKILQRNFSGNEGFSNFTRFLDQIKINYQYSSWT